MQATDIQDVLNTTIGNLGRLKLTDLSHSYQRTVILKRTMRKGKMDFDRGDEAEFTLLTSGNDSARFVPIAARDEVNIPNVTTRGKVGWKHMTWNWAMDHRLISMNAGSENKIYDLVKSQRIAAGVSAVLLFERAGWRSPASTASLEPFGIQHWIVKNATQGFNGGLPSGFTTVGDINPSTINRYKNYTDQYTAVTKDDLIRRMRRMAYYCNFEVLDDEIKQYANGTDRAIYTNYTVIEPIVEILESQNDSLGTDVAPMDGKALFQRAQIQPVTELDQDTTNPVYFIDWATFGVKGLRDWWMRETPVPQQANQHTMSVWHMDCSFNWVCYDRRKNGVIANGTTELSA